MSSEAPGIQALSAVIFLVLAAPVKPGQPQGGFTGGRVAE
ncbi:hypothetical protein EC847_1504 [Scandinavium goeteborgense]|uniref:Uncharacterized protein n=1 Tax=Scandinavium goeteborgense TaxID=1851514 RepID=A0A4V6PQH3_SCAGO|nr:hypothetical protein EC847_1504 [Scandinavium goeteborgense]